jgi:condensin-2 complex subunit D3
MHHDLLLNIFSALASLIQSSISQSICTDILNLLLGSCKSSNVIKAAAKALSILDSSGEDNMLNQIFLTLEKKVRDSVFLKQSSCDFALTLFTFGEVAFYQNSFSSENDIATCLFAIFTDRACNFTDSEKGHAVIAFGKICVLSEEVAKQYIGAIIQQLKNNNNTLVRNNIMVILGDLCKTYTSLADQHVSILSLPLCDENIFVRKHTMLILIQLLQEDFLKLKGPLFFRLLSCVVDLDAEVCNLAKYCFENILLVKYPGLIVNYFIEALYFYNGIRDHPTFNQFGSKEANLRFALTGETNRSQRYTLFSYIIQKMNEEQKFSVTYRICQDVLNNFIDGTQNINRLNEELIHDCLVIMSSKDMKINIGKQDECDDIDDEEHRESLLQAKNYVLDQLQKKHSMQNILPIVISLRSILEKSRSFCVKYVMEYFKALFEDYSKDIQEIFGLSNQVVKELRYDIDRYNLEKAQIEKNKERRRLSMSPGSKSLFAEGSALEAQTPVKSLLKSSRRFSTPRLRADAEGEFGKNRYYSDLVSNLRFE